MICIVANSYQDAKTFAGGQHLRDDEWFYPSDKQDIMARKDFHVIVVNAGDIPNAYLNDILNVAWKQGRMK